MEITKEYSEETKKLVLNNPFSERIILLLENQNLAIEPVLNLEGEMRVPNCLGTAFWVAGVSSLDHPYHAYENELNQHMNDEDDNRDSFIKLLYSNPNNKIPGAFCFSYCVDVDDWHAGIYLGKIDKEDVLFAQYYHEFVFDGSNSYARPKYYIPKTLKTPCP